MIIKKIAIGNQSEAFIEDNLINDLNIIFSNDNNKGKTIVMQGLMYSIGYDSIFPSSFPYKNYFFYSEIEINGETYEFLRKNRSIIIRSNEILQIFNSVTEFKQFFDKNIISIPQIMKDGRVRTVGLSLLYELFFVGQDNRSPSGLIVKGQFDKKDFKNMILELKGIKSLSSSKNDIEEIKNEINSLKIQLRTVRSKLKLRRKNPHIAELVSKTIDNEQFIAKKKIIDGINKSISELKKTRQRELNRKSKLENLLSELNSLNMTIDVGKIKCGDCGSSNIIYANRDINFDVSNVAVKNNIIASIVDNIKNKIEIIEALTFEINSEQEKLNQEISSTTIDFRNVLIFQDDVLKEQISDDESASINSKINILQDELNLNTTIGEKSLKEKKDFFNKLVEKMNTIYKTIDVHGNLIFDDVFAKKDLTYSGSESQEYYFCRLIAINNELKHEFPIIIDSFRDGEISTSKESIMLDFYKKLKKQVILTSTLKDEETDTEKYLIDQRINAIDYSQNADSKILDQRFSKEFNEIIDRFEGLIMS